MPVVGLDRSVRFNLPYSASSNGDDFHSEMDSYCTNGSHKYCCPHLEDGGGAGGGSRRESVYGGGSGGDPNAVLNEDTDSFIIGDRVWVHGRHPGRIAFLGETKLGSGDWAGVALDEPVGKHDGTVSGVKYFQCQPNHGTFARLTRLTTTALFPADGYCDSHGASPPKYISERQRSPSPFISKSGSASPRTNVFPARGATPVRSSVTPPRAGSPAQMKLGDRVIVQSKDGTKRGTLKFMGSTQFAPGDWAGIELDHAVGRNDGSVNGIRYFQCKMCTHCESLYGLFAPLNKVSVSPANRTVSSGIGTRQLSRESGLRYAREGSYDSDYF